MKSGATYVSPGERVRLKDVDPDAAPDVERKGAEAELAEHVAAIGKLQKKLYAENRRSLLVVFQGMDTSGKDGTVRDVFAGVNVMGLEAHAFVPPSEEERDHDFLWRIHKRMPRHGNIGVFNRSHYEDIVAVRVRQILPKKVWQARYGQVNTFEELMTETGTTIVKLFLHISQDEQKKRLEKRLEEPAKRWKFSQSDLADRALWPEFRRAYEDVFERTSKKYAPWYIVPANAKWYRNLVVARIVRTTLSEMDPSPPRLDAMKIKIV